MSRAGGQQNARSLICKGPPLIPTPARGSRIPAAPNTPAARLALPLLRRTALNHAMAVRFVGASFESADRRAAGPRRVSWASRSHSRRVVQSTSPAIRVLGLYLRERSRPQQLTVGKQTVSGAALVTSAEFSVPHSLCPFSRRRSPGPPGIPFGLARAKWLSATA